MLTKETTCEIMIWMNNYDEENILCDALPVVIHMAESYFIFPPVLRGIPLSPCRVTFKNKS